MDRDEALRLYLRELDTIGPLTRDEEARLLQQVRSHDDEGELAAKRLIEAYLPLVVSIVKRHSSPRIDMLDLIETGNLGLMLAVDTFTGSSGDSFSVYAATRIEDAVLKAIAESQSASERT